MGGRNYMILLVDPIQSSNVIVCYGLAVRS
jgi:hypothetical protein